MYSVNGVPLDNPTYGWRLLFESKPINGVTKGLTSISVPGRHGVLSGIPAFKSAPTITLTVRGPGSNIEALFNLFSLNGGRGTFAKVGDSTRATVFELASITPSQVNGYEELVDVSVSLRIPSADWRSTSLTTVSPTVSGAVTNASILSGITADISDAGIFIGGNFGNMELVDQGSGSWVKTIKTWPNVSSTGILITAGTGQAFRATTASPWVPTDDMSEYIDVSGGGGFRITPTWDSDPSATLAKLKLTVTNSSGVTFSVRALNAFAIRNGGV